MNQDQYKTWINELPALTAAQLNDLSTRVKLLGKTTPKEHSGKQEFGDRVLQAICIVMKRNNAETPSINVLRKSSAYVSSGAKIDDLHGYIEKVGKSKILQDAVLKTALELLYMDLLNWQNVAISSHTLIKQIHRIPSTLNRHFPGYAQSGLLAKLVKGASYDR